MKSKIPVIFPLLVAQVWLRAEGQSAAGDEPQARIAGGNIAFGSSSLPEGALVGRLDSTKSFYPVYATLSLLNETLAMTSGRCALQALAANSDSLLAIFGLYSTNKGSIDGATGVVVNNVSKKDLLFRPNVTLDPNVPSANDIVLIKLKNPVKNVTPRTIGRGIGLSQNPDNSALIISWGLENCDPEHGHFRNLATAGTCASNSKTSLQSDQFCVSIRDQNNYTAKLLATRADCGAPIIQNQNDGDKLIGILSVPIGFPNATAVCSTSNEQPALNLTFFSSATLNSFVPLKK